VRNEEEKEEEKEVWKRNEEKVNEPILHISELAGNFQFKHC